MSKHRMIDEAKIWIPDYEVEKRYCAKKNQFKKKLEAYYTSQQWKDDFSMDEEGRLPKKLKRGILSEDGIYNLLERNKELMERIGTD